MQARTSTWSGTPEALDQWAEHVTNNVKPMVAGLPGNAGAYFFIDRADGKALTLTLWDSEEAAAREVPHAHRLVAPPAIVRADRIRAR